MKRASCEIDLGVASTPHEYGDDVLDCYLNRLPMYKDMSLSQFNDIVLGNPPAVFKQVTVKVDDNPVTIEFIVPVNQEGFIPATFAPILKVASWYINRDNATLNITTDEVMYERVEVHNAASSCKLPVAPKDRIPSIRPAQLTAPAAASTRSEKTPLPSQTSMTVLARRPLTPVRLVEPAASFALTNATGDDDDDDDDSEDEDDLPPTLERLPFDQAQQSPVYNISLFAKLYAWAKTLKNTAISNDSIIIACTDEAISQSKYGSNETIAGMIAKSPTKKSVEGVVKYYFTFADLGSIVPRNGPASTLLLGSAPTRTDKGAVIKHNSAEKSFTVVRNGVKATLRYIDVVTGDKRFGSNIVIISDTPMHRI